jgi:predicted metalloprotease
MIWKGREGSSNIEDQRGTKLGGIAAGGGAIGIIITIIVTLIGGGNAGDVLNNIIAEQQNNTTVSYQETAQETELRDFVSVVLHDTEQIWTEIFKADGKVYKPATLVMFTDSVQSGCGVAGKETGPFYCPLDSKIYIDLSFFNELSTTFGAPGDFAMAYVIAHEVGHNVQNLLGTMDNEHAMVQKYGQNGYSVRLELQADYYAGVWAYYAEKLGYLEKGDLDEALNAASAVGDDRLQKETQGYVVPDTFTHGTSEQRSRWFDKGYEAGTINGGDTFSVSDDNL